MDKIAAEDRGKNSADPRKDRTCNGKIAVISLFSGTMRQDNAAETAKNGGNRKIKIGLVTLPGKVADHN